MLANYYLKIFLRKNVAFNFIVIVYNRLCTFSDRFICKNKSNK